MRSTRGAQSATSTRRRQSTARPARGAQEPTEAPLTLPCEGSGCPPCALIDEARGLCAMCGHEHGLGFELDDDDSDRPLMVAHLRLDLLAMIDRGDFG